MSRFPGAVTDRTVWRGADLERDQSWIVHLDRAEVAELDAALAQVRTMPIEAITRAEFRLPSLATKIAAIAEELENGRGFVLLRGFPMDGKSMAEIRRMYWGFGIQLGEPCSQNKFGHLIGNVRNEGARYGTQNSRGYNSNMALKVHNDSTDVVGLLCVHPAKEGGLSTICSTTSIYNEFLRRRPDLVDQLYEGYHYHLRGEERAGVWPVTPHRIPTFSYHQGKLSCRYVRNAINLVPQRTGVPLTAREIETLDMFDTLSTDTALAYNMELRRGDLQLLNNYVTVHTRTAFVDDEDPAKARLLLRLWLKAYNGRELADDFANRYGADVIRRGVPAIGEPVRFPE
jgi:hypothetical protein